MKEVVVVGSGASAVHFAQSALERGWRVIMLDVGRPRPAHVAPELSFAQLKSEYTGASEYLLGERFEGVLFPGHKGEYYGFPPHRASIFAPIAQFAQRASGFDPLSSFTRGGLAEAWTGGAFPFDQKELADFPFTFDELAPFYDLVAQRIGISGADDDLARFVPVHRHLEAPLDLDEHSVQLLEGYRVVRDKLHARYGCYVGRSRTAVLRDDHDHRQGCGYLGRCLWGCPRDAIWSPLQHLRELEQHPEFRYRAGAYVTHFEAGAGGVVQAVHVEAIEGGARERIACERLVLAAGTLSSSRIFLESARRASGAAWELDGLMDNRQVLVPFVNLRMLRKAHDPDTYQYHQLALGLEMPEPKEYVHGLITTLKTALVHPIVQSVPFDLRTSLDIFRHAHAALGIVNVNFHDTRRAVNRLALEPAAGNGPSKLVVHYEPDSREPARMQAALKRVRGALWQLSCIVPPGMTHVRPMGASVHYAGTLPMSMEKKTRTTSRDGESHDFANLWFVDGSTLPFLPAKNLTFTLMANAARIAERAF